MIVQRTEQTRSGDVPGILQRVYISHAHRDFSDEALLGLLERSRRYNTARGITGVLMCHGSFFAQCLEGPAAEVDTLFGRMERDERHHSVVVVFEQLTEQRAFSQWSMGYTGISSLESLELATAEWEKVEQHHTEVGTPFPGFVLLQSFWDGHKNVPQLAYSAVGHGASNQL